jgi:hypothetical protein
MAAQRGDESTISVKRTGRVAVLLAHRHALAELGGLGRGALAAGTAADDDEIEVMHAGSPLQCTLTVPLARGSFRSSTNASANITTAPMASSQKVSM